MRQNKLVKKPLTPVHGAPVTPSNGMTIEDKLSAGWL